MLTDDASSSPPSSPTAYNDSSPPSSPGPDFTPLDDEQDIPAAPSHASPPLHLLAASAKGYDWQPPDYEKGGKKNRRKLPPPSPTDARTKKRQRITAESSLETVVSSPPEPIVFKVPDRETAIWDQASNEMIDLANGNINLDGRGLSRIPKEFVAELHRLCVLDVPSERRNIDAFPRPPSLRQFNRSTTAPAILGSGLGVSRQEIHLFLAGNQISNLPHELLCVDKLTVLSLRANNLATLPPTIRYLRNLQDLNVSGNRLEYLPAEILALTSLKQVMIFPNPFKSPEEGSACVNGRVVSKTEIEVGPVPNLTELGFRILFSGGSGAPGADNLVRRQLAIHHELPLDWSGSLPPLLARVFRSVHEGSISQRAASETTDEEPSLGICPSPHHAPHTSVFVTPVEERYTWEKAIGTVDAGGTFPMKWRGCLRGCLDFLEPPEGRDEEPHADDDETMEVDEATLFAPVQLNREGGFGDAEFESE